MRRRFWNWSEPQNTRQTGELKLWNSGAKCHFVQNFADSKCHFVQICADSKCHFVFTTGHLGRRGAEHGDVSVASDEVPLGAVKVLLVGGRDVIGDATRGTY